MVSIEKGHSEMEEATHIARLARWIVEFDFEAIPQNVLDLIKFSVLDSIGCAFLGRSEPTALNVLRTVDMLNDKGPCTIIGTAQRTSAVNAVLANGTLIHANEFDDHLASDPTDGTVLAGHPGIAIAVSLAVGEWRKKSGRDTLAATVMGYELFGRFNKLLPRGRPWDHATAYGVVAPAIAGRLMGLHQDQLAHALGLSLAHSATLGVVRHGGTVSSSKLLAGPIVLQTGMLLTLLAAQGVTGPLTAFEEPRGGLIHGVIPDMDPAILTLPIRGKYMAEGVTIKAYPGIAFCQAGIAAALTMRELLTVPLEDLEVIEFAVNDTPLTHQYLNDEDARHPKSKEAADHSYYFLMAVPLLDGELTIHQFEGERWFDPKVCALMNRISFRIDRSLNELGPGTYPCRLRVIDKRGDVKVVEVPYAPGHPSNRLGVSGVEEKFSKCVQGILPASRRDSIIRTVSGLESLPSVEPLMKYLALSP